MRKDNVRAYCTVEMRGLDREGGGEVAKQNKTKQNKTTQNETTRAAINTKNNAEQKLGSMAWTGLLDLTTFIVLILQLKGQQ